MVAKKTTTTKGTAGKSEATAHEEIQQKLLDAKARLDKAKELFRVRSQGIRKAKKVIEKSPAKVDKLKEQIARAKAGTTKSLEAMLKEAKEVEANAAALKKEAVELDKESKKISDEHSTLVMELAELRQKSRTSPSGVVTEKSFKIPFVNALKRRGFVIKYDAENVPTGATNDNGVDVSLDRLDATIKSGKEKKSVLYAQGLALRYVDLVVKTLKTASEEKSKAK